MFPHFSRLCTVLAADFYNFADLQIGRVPPCARNAAVLTSFAGFLLRAS